MKIYFIFLKVYRILKEQIRYRPIIMINPLNAELNPICHLLALLRAHPILHVSRIRVSEEETQKFMRSVCA
jgi:hypothetical protein